ncbi:MAG TPA: ABC transporter permease subunit [Bacteroidia bacterium]|jgi:ABC-2 type transport system permease protein|nr:ABC transporter permease subunit [Bacteroidia bacterium]
MKQILIIARKELQSFFDSLIAYVLLVAFLGFTGFFTWLLESDIFFIKQATLAAFFFYANWAFLIFIPAITMKMLAEENKSGTIELLLTKPVTNWQVLWGKFLACFALIVFALLCTLPYYITVANLGKVDHGVIFCGYFALLLVSAAYISIGIFASSITSNQIISFLIAIVIGIFFQFIFSLVSAIFTGPVGDTLNYLGFMSHYDSISRGVIDSRDLIYFGSIIFLGMILSELSLAKRTISE